MNVLPDQVAILTSKVDALYQMVEQLTNQTADILSELKFSSNERSYSSQPVTITGRYSYSNRSHGGIEHKDVLSDDGYPETESQSGENALAPEVQVQRLTAQLTAAYNRIAALEEQLLAKRVH